MFSLATSIPAATRPATWSGVLVAGPSVQTIFARRSLVISPLTCPLCTAHWRNWSIPLWHAAARPPRPAGPNSPNSHPMSGPVTCPTSPAFRPAARQAGRKARQVAGRRGRGRCGDAAPRGRCGDGRGGTARRRPLGGATASPPGPAGGVGRSSRLWKKARQSVRRCERPAPAGCSSAILRAFPRSTPGYPPVMARRRQPCNRVHDASARPASSTRLPGTPAIGCRSWGTRTWHASHTPIPDKTGDFAHVLHAKSSEAGRGGSDVASERAGVAGLLTSHACGTGGGGGPPSGPHPATPSGPAPG